MLFVYHFRLLWDNLCVILIPRRNYFLLKPQIVTESLVALTYSLTLIPQSGFSEKMTDHVPNLTGN